MKRPLVVHPVLFAILPVATLLARNAWALRPEVAFRSLLVLVALSALLLLILRAVLKDAPRAGIISSITLVLLLSYGHIYSITESRWGQGGVPGGHLYLLAAFGSVLLLGTWAGVRAKRWHVKLTPALNVASAVALVVPLHQIISTESKLSMPFPQPEGTGFAAPRYSSAAQGSVAPDVYYIVLDGYARGDVLKDLYGFDNSPFLQFLEFKGFFVAGESRSNYTHTDLSLASSLNMEYLDFFGEDLDPRSSDRTPLARLIRWSRVRQYLETHGYQTMAFSTGMRATELNDADLFLSPSHGLVNSFETALLSTTAFRAVQDAAARSGHNLFWGYEAHRQRLLFTLGSLADLTEISGPKFVFAHVVAPHPPFVFGPDGEIVNPKRPFRLYDGIGWSTGSVEEYLSGYTGQLRYLNNLLRDLVDSLLARSDVAPVILLQADHGPGSRWLRDTGEFDARERFGILNAYHLPGPPSAPVYQGITPVNSFRVLLNRYFDAGLPLEPDMSFFSTWEYPYDLHPVPLDRGPRARP